MTSAFCFGCAFGLAHMGTMPADPRAVLQPLGACWDCGVFGCSQHAQREQGAYKWVCVSSVVKALSVAAGLDDPDEGDEPALRLESRDDFERRLPLMAEATKKERRRWYEREDELVDRTSDSERQDYIDYGLLADAVGVSTFLLSGLTGEPGVLRRFAEEETDEGKLIVEFRNVK